jgi:prevent-host-death family protein
MDKFLTATEARRQFLKLLEKVREGERVIITHRGKPTAVIIDFERLQMLIELSRLWQDPQSLAHIRAAHNEAKTGRAYRLNGVPTVKRLVSLARSKGLIKRHGG